MRYLWCTFHFPGPFLSEHFSLYMVMVGLRNFSRYNMHARKPYDQPSLNLNNSTIWRATLIIFSEFLHCNTFYEKLTRNPHHDAPFPGRVPVKTLHSARSHNAWKKSSPNFLGACLKGIFPKLCGPISVKFLRIVEMDTLSQNAERHNNLPTLVCAKRGVKFPNSTKAAIFDAACTKRVRGRGPRYGEFLKGSKVLPNAVYAIGLCA